MRTKLFPKGKQFYCFTPPTWPPGTYSIGLDWQSNNIAREHPFFLCLSLPSLHDYDVKVPNFTFYVFRYEAQHGFSKVKVDSVNAQMKRVFEIIKKKRGLKRTGSHFMMLHVTVLRPSSIAFSSFSSSFPTSSDFLFFPPSSFPLSPFFLSTFRPLLLF